MNREPLLLTTYYSRFTTHEFTSFMNGILIIDKPSGITSHDVVAHIRHIVNLPSPQLNKLSRLNKLKVGHGGTLDPLATGVLPILLGSATKLSAQVMSGRKEYIATLKLGEVTDTDDACGKILEFRPVPPDTKQALECILPHFIGNIRQRPPAYSAIKKDGQPAYKLARKGHEVKLEERLITIEKISIIGADLPFVSMQIVCSKGTYIRALARDIGEALGCGAHITALRRVASGNFNIAHAQPLEKVSTLQDIEAVLIAPERL